MATMEKKPMSGKMKVILITLGVIGFFALITFIACIYTVKPNEVAIVTKLGKIKEIQSEPGFHLRAPFVEDTTKIFTGNVLYDIPASDVITSDKKSMIADDYVIWRVVDATKYYQTLGGVKGRAEERIEAAVYNATKSTISAMTQDEVIAARGNTLTNAITEASNSDIAQYGIVIEVASIKALDLPDDNKAAVYDRMISERNNIAESYRAKGQAEKKKIENDTNKTTSITKADARAKATEIEAEGEAEYMKILSDAYNDPDKADFYNFVRGLDALKSLAKSKATIILDKDSEFAKLLYGLTEE